MIYQASIVSDKVVIYLSSARIFQAAFADLAVLHHGEQYSHFVDVAIKSDQMPGWRRRQNCYKSHHKIGKKKGMQIGYARYRQNNKRQGSKRTSEKTRFQYHSNMDSLGSGHRQACVAGDDREVYVSGDTVY
jgi:hypothetical protein